jgi:transcriptional regulator with XRE-family HTH domain
LPVKQNLHGRQYFLLDGKTARHHPVGMTLAEYLASKHMTYAEFAEITTLSVPTIWKLANGKVKPSLDTMLIIERASDGSVTAQDFSHQHGGVSPEAAD